MKRILAAAAVALTGFAAAAQEAAQPAVSADEADYAALVDRALGGYILPAYAALHESTTALAAATETYCKDPGARAAVEAAFADVHDDWAGVDFLRFGPMADEGRLERFYFWPDPRGIGERQLRQIVGAQDAGLLDVGRLAEQSAAVQGLAAYERLVFDPARAIEAPGDDGRYRCALAASIARNLDAIAAEVDAAWTADGGWADLMRAPAGELPVYLTHAEVANELLKALLTGLEQLKDQRIRTPMGETPEEARPARAPFNRSGLTIAYWRATIGALDRFARTADFAVLATDARWIGGSVAFETRQIERVLGELGSLEETLTGAEGRERLTYVITALTSLRTTYGETLAAAAGLSPGFNALDGD